MTIFGVLLCVHIMVGHVPQKCIYLSRRDILDPMCELHLAFLSLHTIDGHEVHTLHLDEKF